MRSLKYLQLEDDAELQASFLATFRHFPLRRQSVVTAMAVLKKSHTEDDAVSCLVVASENGDVYVLDPEAFTVLKQVLKYFSLQRELFSCLSFHSLFSLPLYYTFPLSLSLCLSVSPLCWRGPPPVLAPVSGSVPVSDWTTRCGVPHLFCLQRQLHLHLQEVIGLLSEKFYIFTSTVELVRRHATRSPWPPNLAASRESTRM